MATERAVNDFYPTQPELALAITKLVASLIPMPGIVIEPSAGTEAFIKAAKQVWPTIPACGVDVDSAMQQPILAAGADGVYIGDWVEAMASHTLEPGTLILGNPPFSLAELHIRAGIDALPKDDFNVALLRMSFLGSQERVPFWAANPARYIIPLVPRPKFIPGKSGDNSEYAVFMWQKGFKGTTQLLPTLVWRALKKGKAA